MKRKSLDPFHFLISSYFFRPLLFVFPHSFLFVDSPNSPWLVWPHSSCPIPLPRLSLPNPSCKIHSLSSPSSPFQSISLSLSRYMLPQHCTVSQRFLLPHTLPPPPHTVRRPPSTLHSYIATPLFPYCVSRPFPSFPPPLPDPLENVPNQQPSLGCVPGPFFISPESSSRDGQISGARKQERCCAVRCCAVRVDGREEGVTREQQRNGAWWGRPRRAQLDSSGMKEGGPKEERHVYAASQIAYWQS